MAPDLLICATQSQALTTLTCRKLAPISAAYARCKLTDRQQSPPHEPQIPHHINIPTAGRVASSNRVLLDCRAAMKACSPSASAQAAAQQPSRMGIPATGRISPCLQSSSPGHASSDIAAASSPAAAAMHNDADQCTHNRTSAGLPPAHSSHGGDSRQAEAWRSDHLMLPSGREGSQAGAAHQMHDSISATETMHSDLWTQEGGVVDYPPAYRQLVRLYLSERIRLMLSFCS